MSSTNQSSISSALAWSGVALNLSQVMLFGVASCFLYRTTRSLYSHRPPQPPSLLIPSDVLMAMMMESTPPRDGVSSSSCAPECKCNNTASSQTTPVSAAPVSSPAQ